MDSKVDQELPPKVMARLLTLLASIAQDMLDDDKFCEQMNVIAPRLVELTIDEGRTDEVRQNAINLLRVLRKRDGTIPDDIVEDMLKIIWNYAGSGYKAFDIQGAVLFEIIIEWHPILTGEQWSIIAASTSGLEAGSEQDFLGHLKGRAPYRKVRPIDVARVSAYRRRIEAINILK